MYSSGLLRERRFLRVRYMVGDRMRKSVYQYMSEFNPQKLPFKEAIRIMRDTVKNLKDLHSHGIIDGDIHPGYVVYMDKQGKVRLIDFGLALSVDELIGKPTKIRQKLEWVHSFFSPWQLLGFRKSFRDDVFNAIQMGAWLMHGKTSYIGFLEEFISTGNGRGILDFKSKQFIFEFTGGITLNTLLANNKLANGIKRLLNEVLEKASDVEELVMKPDYDFIIQKLNEIYKSVPDTESFKTAKRHW